MTAVKCIVLNFCLSIMIGRILIEGDKKQNPSVNKLCLRAGYIHTGGFYGN